ncbi:MAG: hypothetical protein Q9172_007696, partial [Xanthocarpia lactea]
MRSIERWEVPSTLQLEQDLSAGLSSTKGHGKDLPNAHSTLPTTRSILSTPALSVKEPFLPNKYTRKPTVKMVKLVVLFALGLSALTSLVVASNCKNGIEYCGYNLLNK